MKKIGIIVASILVVLILLAIACSQSCKEKTEAIKINDSGNKTADVTKPVDGNGQTKQTPDNAGKPENNGNTATDKPAEQGKPEEGDPCKPVITDTSDIPQTTVEAYKESQMINAMKLIPKETFEVKTGVDFSILNFSNIKGLFDRMKYRQDKDADKMIRYAPMLMQEAMMKPLNDFERTENLLWTVTNITTFTTWMAGNFGANMNMIPMLTKEKYKKNTIVYGYNLYVAPESAANPRYGSYAMPLADNFAMISNSDISGLAKNSVMNITEKGDGMLSEQKLAQLVSYLGDPEACSIIRNDTHYADFAAKMGQQSNLPPDVKEIPKEVKLLQQGIKELCGYERSDKLRYIGVGFYPNEEYALKFMLLYDEASIVKSDMMLLREFWNKPVLEESERWRSGTDLKETRFSVKDNMGFVECKVNAQLPGIDVINSISVGIGQNLSLPFVKQ